ncbi:MAG: electron transfer flavoprotein subunit beta/FixA family protein [Erysipelotrichaceae bacterium]|nr:electron transfer flavoprotein subunit beta/FixA family protein [Erysipelotrichaceae bacterium]
MRIIVCVKQVPDTQKVQVDPVTGVLIRNGIDTKMNPYDLYALETALRIKEKTGAEIHVISMGPDAAKAVLVESMAMGADEAWLLSDRRFAGADVLATSFTLAQGIKAIGDVDLILCGKQTTDGDTAQVGPAIGEVLNMPHVSWVRKLVDADDKGLVVQQEMMDSVADVRLNYPCLLTVEKGIFEPGLPSYLKMKEARKKEIHVLNLDKCECKDTKRYGLSGSPTQVEKIFEPMYDLQSVRLEGSTEDNAKALLDKLVELKVAGGK